MSGNLFHNEFSKNRGEFWVLQYYHCKWVNHTYQNIYTLPTFTPLLKQCLKALKGTLIKIQRLKKKQQRALCCCIGTVFPIVVVLVSVGIGIQTSLMKHHQKTLKHVDGDIPFG